MAVLAKEQNVSNFGHISVMPSYVAVHWDNNVKDTWLFRKVRSVTSFEYKSIMFGFSTGGRILA